MSPLLALDPAQHATQSDPAGTVRVGVVVGTHGYDGRVRVRPESDNPDRFRPGSVLHIAGRPYRTQQVTGTPDLLLMKLRGLDTREEAAELIGEPILILASAVSELPEGTYYHFQLIGMEVRAESGEALGTLTEIINTGANDVYVVTSPEGELLLPAIADVVCAVNVDESQMTVRVLEGLERRPLKPAEARPRPRRRPRKGTVRGDAET